MTFWVADPVEAPSVCLRNMYEDGFLSNLVIFARALAPARSIDGMQLYPAGREGHDFLEVT